MRALYVIGATVLALEIGRRVLGLLGQQPADDELKTGLGLAEMGMDSLVGVEVRRWWKLSFGFEASLLEMLGMGTPQALRRDAADGLHMALGRE
ncbi:hypothetical protein F4818DRAFT_445482 [Hypoxylon cercidicola]|nr:hypothetical protein F4818DRAFT_445482 [Hypoxylon cercidicola]